MANNVEVKAMIESRALSSRRIVELDGLRAVAIALVVAYHFDLHVRGGFIGVDLFFVISGLVITRALLAQISSVDSSGAPIGRRQLLSDFYLRRTWRLVPSLVVILALVVAGAKLFPGPDLRYTTDNAVASLSGFANWWVRSTATKQGAGALTHTWSLAIEEQFYLVLPVVLVLGRRIAERMAIVLSVMLVALSVGIFATMRFDLDGFNQVYFSSFARATPIALGVLLGVWSQRRNLARRPAHRIPTSHVSMPMLSVTRVLLGGALLPILALADFNSRWLYRGGFHLLSIMLAAIVAISVVLTGSNDIVSRLLRSRPALLIGERSYVLYLTHFPLVYRFDSFGRVGGLAMKVAATVVATELLHRLVEKPLRRVGPQMTCGWLLVAVQVLAAIVSIGYLVA